MSKGIFFSIPHYIAPYMRVFFFATTLMLSCNTPQALRMDNDADTALSYSLRTAASRGLVNLVESLLAQGAAINQGDDDGKTALHDAAFRGHEAVVNTLLTPREESQEIAAINQGTDEGATALHFAAREGHEAVVNTLLTQGAAINQGDVEGATALHIAAINGCEAVINTLLTPREEGQEIAAINQGTNNETFA